MDTVKLGKKGQVSIPRAILRRLGIEGEVPMLVDMTDDGAIILRPAAVYPIEIYSDARVREFDESDAMDSRTARHVSRALARNKK